MLVKGRRPTENDLVMCADISCPYQGSWELDDTSASLGYSKSRYIHLGLDIYLMAGAQAGKPTQAQVQGRDTYSSLATTIALSSSENALASNKSPLSSQQRI